MSAAAKVIDLKPRFGGLPLGPGIEAIIKALRRDHDSIAGVMDGPKHYWAFTKTGIPIDARFVRKLIKLGAVEPYGAQIVAGLPQCLVLTAASDRKEGQTPCGADSASVCAAGRGKWCSACMPVGLYKRMRAGEVELDFIEDPA